jgi:hypothetical protein
MNTETTDILEKFQNEFAQIFKPEKNQVDPNPVIGKCSKCGLELHKAMMYSCRNFPCPSGLGSKGTL